MAIKLSLSKEDFSNYMSAQLNTFFPDKNAVKLGEFRSTFDIAIDRLDKCFSKVAYGRYHEDGLNILNHLYVDQYLMFVWFLSSTFWQEKNNKEISTKLYYLNKVLHGFDCMYDTMLPEIFLIFHGGTGTLLGKAEYSDYFVALHGCTIGSHKGKYPVMGKGVALTAHSSVIGDCQIGDRVSIANNSAIFEMGIPSDSVAFTDRSGKLTLKKSNTPYAAQFFTDKL